MSTRLISRDPFARTELHKRLYSKQHECGWCGQVGKVYEFETQSDGGRTFPHPGKFCSVSCFRSFHS